MGVDPRTALDRLRSAASSGELDDVCERYQVHVLVAFGSAIHGDGDPHDLDLAIRLERGSGGDLLVLLEELSQLAGTDRLDVMDLGRAGPVARERALVATVPLYESERGAFAQLQIAAMLERMDTDWLRRLELDLLAG